MLLMPTSPDQHSTPFQVTMAKQIAVDIVENVIHSEQAVIGAHGIYN